MEIINFFKTLNKKINTLDKITPKSNPFITTPTQITLVWVDEECPVKKRFEENK